jgi:hypothetical protein
MHMPRPLDTARDHTIPVTWRTALVNEKVLMNFSACLRLITIKLGTSLALIHLQQKAISLSLHVCLEPSWNTTETNNNNNNDNSKSILFDKWNDRSCQRMRSQWVIPSVFDGLCLLWSILIEFSLSWQAWTRKSTCRLNNSLNFVHVHFFVERIQCDNVRQSLKHIETTIHRNNSTFRNDLVRRKLNNKDL